MFSLGLRLVLWHPLCCSVLKSFGALFGALSSKGRVRAMPAPVRIGGNYDGLD